MAAASQDALEGVERRRAQLQASVDKLHKALAHWTTWEAEYEMLREGIREAQDPSPSQIRDIARDCDTSLLNDKELDDLLGNGDRTDRTANQVIDLLSRRIDYVQKNSATLEKQLDLAEKQLAGVDVLLEPGVDNEEGLPMMDIEEELDEHGNEISSSINQTGQGAAEIVEVLRKAGLQKAQLEKASAKPTHEPSTPSPTTLDANTPVPSETAAILPATFEPTKDEALEGASKLKPPNSKNSSLQRDGYNEDLAAINFSSGTKVIELDEDDSMIASYPIIPQGESLEDAELRRQMLQYGLSEVGQVVAELDLDRPTVSYSDDDEDEDSDNYEYNTEDDEDEDEYGRGIKPVITDEYRRQMLALEQKLGARMLENIGPELDSEPLADHMNDVRTMRVRTDDDFDQGLHAASSAAPKNSPSDLPRKKGVRFADDLDISRPSQPGSQLHTSIQTPSLPVPTIANHILERTPQAIQATEATNKPKKVSKFKNGRTSSLPPWQMLPTPVAPDTLAVPTGPSGRTIANTITEHLPTTAAPQPPDEFDPLTVQRQVQGEYHKARNKWIQQQGGFQAAEDDEKGAIVEERDGKTKKVSRFMAARLKADGL